MKIINRDGIEEDARLDAVTERIKIACSYYDDIDLSVVDPVDISTKVCSHMKNGISSVELDNITIRICMNLALLHPDFGKLGSRIAVNNHQKNVKIGFCEAMELLYNNRDTNDEPSPKVNEELINVVRKHSNEIEQMIKPERDYLIDFFGLKTLERSYFSRVKEKIVETPQYMWMRVAIGIWGFDLERVKNTYDLMSQKYFTHATPTLFNSGTKKNNLISCFLLGTNDSVDGIFDTVKDCANISKVAGGIGIHVSNIRAKGSYVRGTSGESDGILPMLRVYNETARYINQGGRRNGSFACFVKDTEIFTNNGVKYIQDVEIGDMVITYKNRLRPVVQKHKNPLGDRKIYKLEVQRNKPIYVTGNHRFWSFYTKKYKDKKLSMGWNSVEDLKKLLDYPETKRQTHYIYTPSMTNIEDKNNYTIDVTQFNIPVKEIEDNQKVVLETCKGLFGKKVNKIWNITENFANLIGIWLGDGCLKKQNNKIYGICFTVHNKNKGEIEFIKKTCKETFGFDTNVYQTKSSVTTVCVYSRIVGFVFEKLFKSGFNNKELFKDIFNWPKRLVNSLIAGLITTDGHVRKNKLNATLGLSNKKLMTQLYHLCRANGITCSFNKNKKYNNMTKDPYSMSIPLSKDIVSQLYKHYEDDRLERLNKKTFNNKDNFLKILNITETDIQEDFVYTLGVEEDHSYMVEGLIAENCYLEPWHADIIEFLYAKRNHGNDNERARDLFYALWISDLFMERVKNDEIWSLMCPDECPGLNDTYGEEFEILYKNYESLGKYKKQIKAREVWDTLITTQIETGMPYMCYKDHANRKSNQKNIGVIKSSNLCVAPETRILTKTGYFPIKELENEQVNVWNGEEWSETTIRKTGENKKLIEIKLSNGTTLNCTPYHRFSIETKNTCTDKKSKPVVYEAKNLKIGMKLIKYNLGMVKDNKKEFKYAYTAGLHSADGTYYKSPISKIPGISLYGDKKKLIHHLDIRTSSFNETKQGVINVLLPRDLPEKFTVPINYSIDSKLRWLEGFFDGDGCVTKNNNLQASSIHQEFLNDIKLMLQTIGINSKVTLNKKKGKTLLPDGKGGKKMYNCKEIYRLLIPSTDVHKLTELKFSPNRLKISIKKPKQDTSRYIEILDIKDNNRYDDTYCFTEKKRGMGMFEGILTNNCSEIMLYSDDKEYACCNLVSIRLPSYVVPNIEGIEEVKVYTKENCSYCKMAKALLIENKIKFTQVSLDDKELRDLFFEKYQVSTVPQIFVNGERIGGYTDLLKKIRPKFDFEKMGQVVHTAVENLNKIIDINFYPVEKTKKSNFKHRPIGIGVQGLADVFMKMWLPYDSPEAKELNKQIFESMYYYAMEKSMLIAKERSEIYNSGELEFNEYENFHEDYPGAYSTFYGSPLQKGEFQFDLWNVTPSERYNWDKLRTNVKLYGVRNSTLIALMPTASTAQILGSTEGMEVLSSNMYVRRTLAGEFKIVNNHLMKTLNNIGMWDEKMKTRLMFHRGSVQKITSIPKEIRDIYKTAYEIKQKDSIQMSADRGAFVCQSQSLNIFVQEKDPQKLAELLTKIHFYSYLQGLKTGSYYIRSRAAIDAQQFSIDPKTQKELEEELNDEPEDCLMCGS